MRSLFSAILLAAILASLADRSLLAWSIVRSVAFLGCAFLVRPQNASLPFCLLAACASVAVSGLAGLDLAIACLAFACINPRLLSLAALCAAVGIVGALSLAYQHWDPHWTIPLFPFHNRNHYAVFCELSLPLLVYAWRRARNPYYLASAAILLIAALAAGSRAGAILLIAEAVILAGRRNLLLSIPAVALAASLFVLASGSQRIGNPLEGDHRLEIWRSTIEMIRERPLTGWGVGEFTRIYPAYASFDNGQFVNAAHSDWLEWASEFGVPATLASLVLILRWLRKSFHFYPSWGILVGALHALVDFPFHLPGLLVFAAALAGSIQAHGATNKTQSSDPQGRHP